MSNGPAFESAFPAPGKLRTKKRIAEEEARRLAGREEYRILPECNALVREVANELNIESHLDPH